MAGPKTADERRRVGIKGSTFLTKGLSEINKEIKTYYGKVLGKDKVWDTYDKVTRSDVEAVAARYKGRCVYCDKSLSYIGTVGKFSARLAWYVPLNVGGAPRPDNLVVVCARCKTDYTSVRKVRQDVEGLDSFADVIERLVKAVQNNEDPHVIEALKSRLNVRLADVATCMRYVTTSDWKPDKFEQVIEQHNTIGELIEQQARGKDVKKEITQTTKQIVTTKQYKIIRARHGN